MGFFGDLFGGKKDDETTEETATPMAEQVVPPTANDATKDDTASDSLMEDAPAEDTPEVSDEPKEM